jgi:hypothetical protein
MHKRVGVGVGEDGMQLNITRIIFNNFVMNEIYLRISLKSAVGRQDSEEQSVNVTDLTV